MKRTSLSNPNIIAGIHNYCDSWCERCGFTSRCAIYYEIEKSGKVALIEQLIESLHKAHELLENELNRLGIPLPTAEKLAEANKKNEQQQQLCNEHHLKQWCDSYCKNTNEWRKREESMFLNHSEELAKKMELGILSNEEALAIVEVVEECLKTVFWYHTIIPAKMTRAISSAISDAEWGDDEDDTFPKDSDGSAKVALLSCEKSLLAWVKLYEIFPEHNDSMLPLMSALQKIIREIEQVFPNARAFVRPGFDE